MVNFIMKLNNLKIKLDCKMTKIIDSMFIKKRQNKIKLK